MFTQTPTFDGTYKDFRRPIIRGDDYELPFVVRIPDGGADPPYDDTNSERAPLGDWGEIWCTGKLATVLNRPGDDDALFQLSKSGGGVVITDPDQGMLKVIFTPDVTGTLPTSGEVRVDIQGVDAAGKVHTLCTGVFPIRADVTRRTT